MDQTKENLPLLPTNSTKVTFLFPSPLGSRKASAAAVRNKGTGRGKTAERDSLPLASWSHGILSLPTQGMFRSPSSSPIPTVTSLKGTSRNGANGGWVKRYAITMQRLRDSVAQSSGVSLSSPTGRVGGLLPRRSRRGSRRKAQATVSYQVFGACVAASLMYNGS